MIEGAREKFIQHFRFFQVSGCTHPSVGTDDTELVDWIRDQNFFGFVLFRPFA